MPLGQRRKDFGFFREYYFMHNNDRQRLARFQQVTNP
jgi:hypothetical protein